jgi:hypothetical protein
MDLWLIGSVGDGDSELIDLFSFQPGLSPDSPSDHHYMRGFKERTPVLLSQLKSRAASLALLEATTGPPVSMLICAGKPNLRSRMQSEQFHIHSFYTGLTISRNGFYNLLYGLIRF